MNKCRGCDNEFAGHSKDESGIYCELCGTKNHIECSIDSHLVTDDGKSCECGYFVSKAESLESYKRGYIESGINLLTT